MIFPFLQFTPDWAPNLHPLVVHFPIAILFFAAFMDLISFVLPLSWWGERKTAITYLIGGICVVLVLFTGHWAAHSLDLPKSAYHAVGEHAEWATWTAWFFGIYAVIRFVVAFFERARRPTVHLLFFLVSLVGLFFLFETAEHGGKLVFQHGLGTPDMERPSQKMDQMNEPGFHQAQNGDLSWVADQHDIQTIGAHFKFLKGDTTALTSPTSADGDSSQLTVENSDFFITTKGKSYSDIQLKVKLQPSTYQGDIVVAHNVQDTSNYGYLVLHPDGAAQLGRYQDGKKSVIKQGTFKGQKVQQITLSISGEHIHGAVNGEEILHGHAEQKGPGAAGLKLEGPGMITLHSFSVSKISGEEHHEDHH